MIPVKRARRYAVHIGWGESPDAGAATEQFSFKTIGERDAFLLGIRSAMGWQDVAWFTMPCVYDSMEQQWRSKRSGVLQ